MSRMDDRGQERAAAPCPICSRPATMTYRPFCSKRCADVDLNRWLGEGYIIPDSVDDHEAEAPSPAQSDDDDDRR